MEEPIEQLKKEEPEIPAPAATEKKIETAEQPKESTTGHSLAHAKIEEKPDRVTRETIGVANPSAPVSQESQAQPQEKSGPVEIEQVAADVVAEEPKPAEKSEKIEKSEQLETVPVEQPAVKAQEPSEEKIIDEKEPEKEAKSAEAPIQQQVANVQQPVQAQESSQIKRDTVEAIEQPQVKSELPVAEESQPAQQPAQQPVQPQEEAKEVKERSRESSEEKLSDAEDSKETKSSEESSEEQKEKPKLAELLPKPEQ